MRIKKGMDLPITGRPKQVITDYIKTSHVAVTGVDYVGMKPSMLVKEGDKVKAGQPIFSCKKSEGVIYTAPASGVIAAVNRGERRAFQNIVIKTDEEYEFQTYSSFLNKPHTEYSSDELRALMVDSGWWTAFRTRPFSKIPATDTAPASIFVTAMDTNPLAVDPEIVITEFQEFFKIGLECLSQFTENKVYVCKDAHATFEVPAGKSGNLEVKEFEGVHPAGNVGTHIHFIDPVSANKTVWHLNYQEVISLGVLVGSGRIWTDRVIALAGPTVNEPCLYRVSLGADLSEVVNGKLAEGESRVVSGSALNGRTVDNVFKYLGKFHLQVSALSEGREREFFGWHSPGINKFSLKNIYLSKLMPNKLFNMNTNKNGSDRAMVPIGSYEKVMPLDILPTQLLRALLTKDTDLAQQLGALELDEEDLSLCTFACPGKIDFGPVLRQNLDLIEKEG